MSKSFWFNIFIFGLTVLLTWIVTIAFITRAFNFELISIQWLYEVLDRKWGIIRSIIMILTSSGGFLFLVYFKGPLANSKSLVPGLIMIFVGLVFGLLIFYGFSCCDTPVGLYLGFPLSWLRGIAPTYHFLPIPIVPYLFQNFKPIGWYLDTFSLIMDILFWYIVGVIAYAFVREKIKGTLQGI